MRIIIDARKIMDFGIGQYIRQLLVHYNRFDRNDEYIVIVKKGDYPQVCQSLNANFKIVPVNTGLYSLKEMLSFGLFINRLKGDIVHFPHFTVPLFIKTKVITTIHDIIYLKYIDIFYGPLHKIYLFPVMSHAVKRSDAIITVSKTTRHDLLDYYKGHTAFKILQKKINTVYNGISPVNYSDTVKPEGVLPNLPFFLYVGNLKPHKNLINLIRGFSLFLREGGRIACFILAGIGNSDSCMYFLQYIKKYTDPDRIIALGHLSDKEIAWLYKNALGLCLVSLCEGFGLPALEAVYAGTPVIVSKGSAMQEYLKDTGIFVNPFSLTEIRDALCDVFDNNSILRRSLKTKSGQISGLQWANTAEKTYNIYKRTFKSVC